MPPPYVKPQQSNAALIQQVETRAPSRTGNTWLPEVVSSMRLHNPIIERSRHGFDRPPGMEFPPEWSLPPGVDTGKIPGYDGPDKSREGYRRDPSNPWMSYDDTNNLSDISWRSCRWDAATWNKVSHWGSTRGNPLYLEGTQLWRVDDCNDGNKGSNTKPSEGKDTSKPSGGNDTSNESADVKPKENSDQDPIKDTGGSNPSVEKDPEPEGGDPDEMRSPAVGELRNVEALRAAVGMELPGRVTPRSPGGNRVPTGDQRPSWKRLPDYSRPDPEGGGPDEFRNPIGLTAVSVNLRNGATSLSGESGGEDNGPNGPISPDPGWNQSSVQSRMSATSGSGMISLGISATMSPAIGDNGKETGGGPGPVDPRR